ncbi:iron chaperone [Nocardia sp. NPDC059177]|uniref:iron chaperone n=1 Tax=Nocardia sp. NPDC059177 TaxID=3346759 RepID=UPI003697EC6A
MAAKPESVEAYLAGQPEQARAVLEQIRETIHRAVPGSGETISYAMPTATVDGRGFITFAGWKAHVSLYPIPDGDEALGHALAPYISGRGTLKFPLGEPIPYDLIGQVAVRLAERAQGR